MSEENLETDAPKLSGPTRSSILKRLAKPAFSLGATALILVSGFGGWWFAVGPETARDLIKSAQTDEEAPSEDARYVALPEITANLSVGARPSFIKARIIVEAPNERAAIFERREGEIVDVLQEYIRQLTPRDLEGAAGFHRFRAGARRRIELLLGEDVVRDVYVVELLSQ